MKAPSDPRPPALTLRDIECLKTLGGGSFGRVLLVRTKRNEHKLDKPHTLFALKAVPKRMLRSCINHFEETQRELSKLADLPWNPFICNIIQTFHDRINIYMMLELIPCGTLYSLIYKEGHLELNASRASFYFSNIACGLKFLHGQGILHCDMKPANILLGEDGYLCLTDFGSSAWDKDSAGDAFDLGTTAYQPPESRFSGTDNPMSPAIDWWAAGCILYEMTTRRLVRSDHVPHHICAEIGRFSSLFQICSWPPGFRVGKHLKSIVADLLEINPKERLGTDGKPVFEHPWLQNVNWMKMERKQYLAPYLPNCPSSTDAWHSQSLPNQREVPGLKVVEPALHLAHDNRFPL
ncbi:kinase-like domain-containing protein [Crucibulum laeve]|uniref:non-specific serine/threonine protein kinase n=1 Tax=Crucibulum laeve TaxID=68775 RepID=A0A5C3MAH8_9AGAR|nr:kinase-like domain-containing protein [Crucibulum laeve]